MFIIDISTELADVKAKGEIKKRNGFCKRLDVKFKLFSIVVGEFQ